MSNSLCYSQIEIQDLSRQGRATDNHDMFSLDSELTYST
jgi:hypothetical protein